MRRSVVVAVVGVLVLAAGGAYYGLAVYPQQRFRAGLDQTLATLPPGTTATYKDAQYSVLSHRAVVTGVTLHAATTGPSPQRIDATIESVEATKPNLDFAGSWTKALADRAAVTQDTVLPIAESVAVKGLVVKSTPVNGTLESVRIDRLRLYPWALLHAGRPAWSELRTALVPRGRPPTLAELQPLLRAEAAVMLAIACDGYEAGHMQFATTLPDTDIAYAIDKVTTDGFDRGVMKGATVEGVTAKGTRTGTFAIDHARVGAIDVREPMTRIVNGDALSPALLNGIGIGRITYAGITVQPPGLPPFHAGGFSLGPVAFAQGMPVSASLAWQDVVVSTSQLRNPRARMAFAGLGLDTITTSFGVSYDWDVAGQRASLHDTMLKVNELGTLTVSADLTDVVPGASALKQARLAHGRLRFDDASLVERLLRMGAARAGADPDAYRALIADMIRNRKVTEDADSPLLAAVRRAVADFITSPHSLTIELAPATPVPFVAFKGAAADPAQSAAMLGLAVSANQP